MLARDSRMLRLIRGERPRLINSPITLTAGEAAAVVGLAPSTLAKLRLNGTGPSYCKLGRSVRYRRQDLEAWLESRLAQNTSDAARLPKSLTAQPPSPVPPVDGTGSELRIDDIAPSLDTNNGRAPRGRPPKVRIQLAVRHDG
jgi:excisionase family DNA binding protein